MKSNENKQNRNTKDHFQANFNSNDFKQAQTIPEDSMKINYPNYFQSQYLNNDLKEINYNKSEQSESVKDQQKSSQAKYQSCSQVQQWKQNKNENCNKKEQDKNKQSKQRNQKYHRQLYSRKIKTKKIPLEKLQKSMYFYEENIQSNMKATQLLDQFEQFHSIIQELMQNNDENANKYFLSHHYGRKAKDIIKLSHYGNHSKDQSTSNLTKKKMKRKNEGLQKQKIQHLSKSVLLRSSGQSSVEKYFIKQNEEQNSLRNFNNSNQSSQLKNNNKVTFSRASNNQNCKNSKNNHSEINNQKYLGGDDSKNQQSKTYFNSKSKNKQFNQIGRSSKFNKNQHFISTTPVRAIYLNKQSNSKNQSLILTSEKKTKPNQSYLNASSVVVRQNHHSFSGEKNLTSIISSKSKQKLNIVSKSKNKYSQNSKSIKRLSNLKENLKQDLNNSLNNNRQNNQKNLNLEKSSQNDKNSRSTVCKDHVRRIINVSTITPSAIKASTSTVPLMLKCQYISSQEQQNIIESNYPNLLINQLLSKYQHNPNQKYFHKQMQSYQQKIENFHQINANNDNQFLRQSPTTTNNTVNNFNKNKFENPDESNQNEKSQNLWTGKHNASPHSKSKSKSRKGLSLTHSLKQMPLNYKQKNSLLLGKQQVKASSQQNRVPINKKAFSTHKLAKKVEIRIY